MLGSTKKKPNKTHPGSWSIWMMSLFIGIPVAFFTNFWPTSLGKDAELYLLELFRPQLPETRRWQRHATGGSSETPGKSSDGLHGG